MKKLLLLALSALFATPVFAQVEASQAQAEAGTAGWPYVMTPRRTAYAISQQAAGTGDMTKATYDADNDGTVDDADPAGTALAPALFAKANDNTSGNRNVATLSGTFTTSTDRNAAAGKRYQLLDPDAATRSVVLTSPGSTGETVFQFVNTGTAASDILNFTDPTPDVEVRAGEKGIAMWNGSGWDIEVSGRSQTLVVLSKSGNYTLGTDSLDELYGGIIYVSGAATITVPAVQSGVHFTVITVGAVAVSVDVDASDRTLLDGTALSDGDKITNTSTAGDIAVFTYESSSGWYATTDGWTDGN